MEAVDIEKQSPEVSKMESIVCYLSKIRSDTMLAMYLILALIRWKLPEFAGAACCVFAAIGILLFGCHIYAARKEYPGKSVARIILGHCKYDIIFTLALCYMAAILLLGLA